MKLFVAGATGLLGRRVVRRLVAGGHAVVGAARSDGNRERLAALGAEARACDLFDAASVAAAAEGCDGVLHLATRIPAKQRSRAADWAENDRLRTDGTRALVAAAVRHGCRLYLQQSVLWIVGDRGEDWVNETAAIGGALPAPIVSSVEMERIVAEAVAAHGLPAVILRGGGFYAADSPQTVTLVEQLRRGIARVPGDGRQFTSLVHLDDMAAAVVAAVTAALERPFAGEVIHVCDDEPVRFATLMAHVAELVGRRPPGGVPRWMLRLLFGRALSDTLTISVRSKNDRAKQRLGWAPEWPTIREGYAQVMAELRA